MNLNSDNDSILTNIYKNMKIDINENYVSKEECILLIILFFLANKIELESIPLKEGDLLYRVKKYNNYYIVKPIFYYNNMSITSDLYYIEKKNDIYDEDEEEINLKNENEENKITRCNRCNKNPVAIRNGIELKRCELCLNKNRNSVKKLIEERSVEKGIAICTTCNKRPAMFKNKKQYHTCSICAEKKKKKLNNKKVKNNKNSLN